MKIKIVQGTVVAQKSRKPGEIVECPDPDARNLIALGLAVASSEKVKKPDAGGK